MKMKIPPSNQEKSWYFCTLWKLHSKKLIILLCSCYHNSSYFVPKLNKKEVNLSVPKHWFTSFCFRNLRICQSDWNWPHCWTRVAVDSTRRNQCSTTGALEAMVCFPNAFVISFIGRRSKLYWCTWKLQPIGFFLTYVRARQEPIDTIIQF